MRRLWRGLKEMAVMFGVVLGFFLVIGWLVGGWALGFELFNGWGAAISIPAWLLSVAWLAGGD
jgi:hypothetical protein